MKSILRKTALGLSIAGIGIGLAQVAAAGPVWDGSWGSWTAIGSNSSCSRPSTVTGHSVINGSNTTQVIAWCDNDSCGGGIVMGQGCTGSGGTGTCATTTPYTYGSSQGSSNGGGALLSHRCREGYFQPN